MPDAMPLSETSSPRPRRDTSAAASSNETSVKTAIWDQKLSTGQTRLPAAPRVEPAPSETSRAASDGMIS